MHNKVTIMPGKNFSKYYDKLVYFEKLINSLYKSEEYLFPVFLLRCQLVEFSLKYLLINHPFYPIDSIEVERFTMGQAVGRIREMKDVHMDNIVSNASELVECRNKLTHHFIRSDENIEKIHKNIKKGMKNADEIEENIFFFDFVDSMNR